MKKQKVYKIRYSRWFLAVIFLVTGISLFSFQSRKEAPSEMIAKQYQKDFQKFKSASKQLKETLQQPRPYERMQELTRSYETLRDAFKAIEFIFEYTDPNFVREYVNGSPLPKLDKSAPQLTIIQPKGLQVLDELIYGENDSVRLRAVVDELDEAIAAYPLPAKVYDRVVMEGMRIELIRMFSLGLTGFDAPASKRSIKEATVVMQTMHNYFSFYREPIEQHSDILFAEVSNLFKKGSKQLHSASFDEFNRLGFLKEVINPLFKALLQVQNTLGIEHLRESIPQSSKLALNLEVDNLFDDHILNNLYYINVPQQYYNQGLIDLGKLLFYDPILSASNDRSCAGCHQPGRAFTDGLPKSMATGYQSTVERNSPTLLNAVWSERLFHDMRAESFEDQLQHVVTSPKEFNTSMLVIAQKIQASSQYSALFQKQFNELAKPISPQTIAFAMSAYVSSLFGFNSTVDRYIRGESTQLDPKVQRGFNLFMGKAACGTCHFAPVFNGTVPPLFNDSESEVLGVPKDPRAKQWELDEDPGRAAARLKEAVDFYKYSFKTPTIRNITLTAPYMHNGAFQSLQEVMDFYNHGGGAGAGLDIPYQTLSPDSLHLSPSEMDDLTSFMSALTDTSGHTSVPMSLPVIDGNQTLNQRKVGGKY